MSSSDAPRPEWGTVYMGLNTLSISKLEGEQRTNWSPADEEAYLGRVKARAMEKAAGIIEEATLEAERIRQEAQESGYAVGMTEAESEINEFRSAMSDSVSAVLSAIEGQCSSIFTQWREELVAVLRLAVEKGVGLSLADDRAQLLQELYTQAVTALENRRNLVIRVNPEDEPAIADIVALTQGKYPDLKAWSVKPDAAIAPGGLTVESEDSLADNRVERRVALVNEILDSLTLPGEQSM